MTDPKVNSILDEGNRLFLQGKFQQAIVYYDKILDEDPKRLLPPTVELAGGPSAIPPIDPTVNS